MSYLLLVVELGGMSVSEDVSFALRFHFNCNNRTRNKMVSSKLPLAVAALVLVAAAGPSDSLPAPGLFPPAAASGSLGDRLAGLLLDLLFGGLPPVFGYSRYRHADFGGAGQIRHEFSVRVGPRPEPYWRAAPSPEVGGWREVHTVEKVQDGSRVRSYQR